ncbi:MAG: Crp/Fnr family transcriptional regulator [Acidobacteria bacterium]|nr:Crp/Fnr family transcriptional regulator [Acidobacteriota bacterium]MBV9478234.1 Crp/Fnr family transcriptional regulator [Acidobacteriota bacterium]
MTNRLLQNFPADALQDLQSSLERVTLDYGQPLIVPNEPIQHVYFPLSALASLVTVLEDGTTVEAGSVGREGMVGIPILLGEPTTPMQTVTQIAGESLRAPASVMKRLFDTNPAVTTLLQRYVHTLFVIASQSAACNRRHDVQARLARWLLMSSDGIDSNDVGITQEYLAAMLGVRRPGVTIAAVKLQEDGFIRYSRGFVQIVDREGLEAAACECYHVVKAEYDRLLG